MKNGWEFVSEERETNRFRATTKTEGYSVTQR